MKCTAECIQERRDHSTDSDQLLDDFNRMREIGEVFGDACHEEVACLRRVSCKEARHLWILR